MTTPISKVKSGISSAISSPANFIVSLGIGFALGAIADLVLEYLARNYITQLTERWEVGFPFYFMQPEHTSIAYDDVILIGITLLMLFTKRFVLTLGFFLGWYMTSNWGLYQAIEEIPK